MPPIRRHAGFPLLMLIAAVALGIVSIFPPKRSGLAVAFPVDLRPGVTRSAPFRAEYKGLYLVELETDPVFERERMECLLGGWRMPGHEPCNDASPLALTWVLDVDGQPRVRGGTSSEEGLGQAIYGGPGETGREFGAVKLEPGPTYVIEVRSLNDASVLAPARPKVKVEVHPQAYKEGLRRMVLGLLASLVIGATALVWLTITLRRGRPTTM